MESTNIFLNFVKFIQSKTDGENPGGRNSIDLKVGRYVFRFGYGYFDRDKVMVEEYEYNSKTSLEERKNYSIISNEEAAKLFKEHTELDHNRTSDIKGDSINFMI